MIDQWRKMNPNVTCLPILNALAYSWVHARRLSSIFEEDDVAACKSTDSVTNFDDTNPIEQ